MMRTFTILLAVGVLPLLDAQKPPVPPEARLRVCIFSIVDETGDLKTKYPELAEFDPATLKKEIGPQPASQWSMGFSYQHNFQPAANKAEDVTFGDHGCCLSIDFRKLDSPDQRPANVVLPDLGVRGFWHCSLPKDEPKGLRSEFEAIVKRNVEKLKKGT